MTKKQMMRRVSPYDLNSIARVREQTQVRPSTGDDRRPYELKTRKLRRTVKVEVA